MVAAKFTVNDVLERKAADGSTDAVIVKLNAVYVPDPSDVNYAFWKATPSASMEMVITNPDAYSQFRRGKGVTVFFEFDDA